MTAVSTAIRVTRRSLAALVLLVGAVTAVLLAAPGTANAATTVCLGQAPPPGQVKIAYTTDLIACGTVLPGSVGNAAVYEVPAPGLAVCEYEPVPAGYVVTNHPTVLACGGLSVPRLVGNASTINPPSVGLPVCSGSPIPPGFRAGAQTTVADCGTVPFGSTVQNAVVLAAA